MEGWIKLHRQLITNGWLRNHSVCIFWIYCLLKATHEPVKTIVGFQEVHLEPGQFIFGRHKASKETRLSEQKIRTCLAFLKKAQNLTIKSTNKFSIISIINWETYQNSKIANNQQVNQHVTTYKNKRKNKDSSALVSAFESFYLAYPKKRDRRNAEKAWSKLNPSPELQQIILTAIERQLQDWQRDNGKFIPYPATWLNGRRWEDEIQEVKPTW